MIVATASAVTAFFIASPIHLLRTLLAIYLLSVFAAFDVVDAEPKIEASGK
jgi:hypothetical protein